MAQVPEKKTVSIDVNEFVRTRDALGSAYISLSAAIDRALKAYLDHTNVVLAGDSSLNISYLTQPFNALAQTAQQALLQGANGHATVGAIEEAEGENKGKRKKRAYKPRDPNAPKRPLTAYFRYLQENRATMGQQLARETGGATQKPGDVTKSVTARWNGLTKPEQQPYRDAYKRALTTYIAEVEKYKAAGGHVDETIEPDADADADDDELAVPNDRGEAEDDEEDDDDSDDDDTDDEEDENALAPPPPPPAPKAPSPETQKKTPKSTVKKAKETGVPPTPQFSSINPEAVVTASMSPERKRKAPFPESVEPESGKKKRGRKTNAEKAASAAATVAAPAVSHPAPVAPKTETATPGATKEKKKKRKVDG